MECLPIGDRGRTIFQAIGPAPPVTRNALDHLKPERDFDGAAEAISRASCRLGAIRPPPKYWVDRPAQFRSLKREHSDAAAIKNSGHDK